ncbi:GIY-YIG nuclease family protein [Marinifilum sp. D714]|uniref:GIY-YIG nuclease family protein n=1 Tax=Marinifilum sp. D714 TaxID=2937523 RepID=UPI0027BD7232|nr:GIY-YIG nuclease family protein [Marinifilum sp. D714]MDQ2179811.1 GIY-YIG nuclease family protein [Marinifilum sp. D714]
MEYRTYQVYILTNKNRTVLYTGVTSNLKERVDQHKEKLNSKSFTARYNVDHLVYYEQFFDIGEAIAREKQIKAGSRQKKLNLINEFNPEWKDLFDQL